MISKEDIKRIKETDFDELRKESPKRWWTEKDATHKNTPIDRYNEPMYQKNASHRNTHHTRHGGRTDHSTSSHGLSPSGTDRVMWMMGEWGYILMGYGKILIRDTWEFIKIIYKVIG